VGRELRWQTGARIAGLQGYIGRDTQEKELRQTFQWAHEFRIGFRKRGARDCGEDRRGLRNRTIRQVRRIWRNTSWNSSVPDTCTMQYPFWRLTHHITPSSSDCPWWARKSGRLYTVCRLTSSRYHRYLFSFVQPQQGLSSFYHAGIPFIFHICPSSPFIRWEINFYSPLLLPLPPINMGKYSYTRNQGKMSSTYLISFFFYGLFSKAHYPIVNQLRTWGCNALMRMWRNLKIKNGWSYPIISLIDVLYFNPSPNLIPINLKLTMVSSPPFPIT